MEHDDRMRVVVGAINGPTYELSKLFSALETLPINIQIGVIALVFRRDYKLGTLDDEKYAKWAVSVYDLVVNNKLDVPQCIEDAKHYVCQWVASG